MILVLLGPPGVGKGTQASRISLHYEIPHISTGAMFRDAVARGTELGRRIQRYRIDKGEYVPDDVVIEAVRQRIHEPDCAKGFLLDGFPRTIVQAETLNRFLSTEKLRLNAVINFDAPIDDIVKRFSGRRVCPVDGSTYHIEHNPPLQPGLCDECGAQLEQRSDDDPVIVKRRLEVYNEKTAPLVDYYETSGLLRTVDASREPETVFGQVVALLEGWQWHI
ncbi:adenylate kinase [Armatimonadota bacterium]|nr:adenylate kinase [Armatimonadota bacterium]GDX39958.1 adenylate kinase [Armatimonadota bacterium]